MPEWMSALILGIVEGATEFIPVSSTGHLILVGHWLGFVGLRADVFEVVIQFGAILAVVWQFRSMLARLVRDIVRDPDARQIAFKVVIAISPAMAAGLLAHRWINGHLFRPQTVAWALLVGGVGILLIERTRPLASARTVSEMSMMTAFGIGVAQVLSLFPGVSRSAATIMGGIALGVRPIGGDGVLVSSRNTGDVRRDGAGSDFISRRAGGKGSANIRGRNRHGVCGRPDRDPRAAQVRRASHVFGIRVVSNRSWSHPVGCRCSGRLT